MGNSLASGSRFLGDVSGAAELFGLGIAAVGTAFGQPEFGLTIMATGGVGNYAAGVIQLGAGALQGIGGGGFGNAGYATISLTTGLVLGRGIAGGKSKGWTASQRASDAFSNGFATAAGGVNDLWAQAIDALSPQQVNCPGGN
jgi:hypothetical protein